MSAKARVRFFGLLQVLLPGLGAAAGAAVRRLVQRRSEAPEVPQLVPGFPADRNSLEGSGLDAVTGLKKYLNCQHLTWHRCSFLRFKCRPLSCSSLK